MCQNKGCESTIFLLFKCKLTFCLVLLVLIPYQCLSLCGKRPRDSENKDYKLGTLQKHFPKVQNIHERASLISKAIELATLHDVIDTPVPQAKEVKLTESPEELRQKVFGVFNNLTSCEKIETSEFLSLVKSVVINSVAQYERSVFLELMGQQFVKVLGTASNQQVSILLKRYLNQLDEGQVTAVASEAILNFPELICSTLQVTFTRQLILNCRLNTIAKCWQLTKNAVQEGPTGSNILRSSGAWILDAKKYLLETVSNVFKVNRWANISRSGSEQLFAFCKVVKDILSFSTFPQIVKEDLTQGKIAQAISGWRTNENLEPLENNPKKLLLVSVLDLLIPCEVAKDEKRIEDYIENDNDEVHPIEPQIEAYNFAAKVVDQSNEGKVELEVKRSLAYEFIIRLGEKAKLILVQEIYRRIFLEVMDCIPDEKLHMLVESYMVTKDDSLEVAMELFFCIPNLFQQLKTVATTFLIKRYNLETQAFLFYFFVNQKSSEEVDLVQECLGEFSFAEVAKEEVQRLASRYIKSWREFKSKTPAVAKTA